MATKTTRPKPKTETAAATTIVRWECKNCQHKWTAHAAIKKCPRCESPKILGAPVVNEKLGRPWKCGACEEIFWVNGFIRQCPHPDCASNEVFPFDGARQCTACYEWHGPDEVSCPDCGCFEFSLEEIRPESPIDAVEPEASDAEPATELSPVEQGRRHLNGAPKPTSTPSTSSTAPKPDSGEFQMIAVRDIVANPDNPRRDFDAAELEIFAQGIKQVGILEPLLVRPVIRPAADETSGEKGLVDIGLLTRRKGPPGYMLLGGERRWRSAKLLRLEKVPCRIFDVTDEEAAEILARENDHKDLNPIEKARQYQLLLDRCGINQESLAKRYGVSQETVSKSLRLLQLREPWLTWLIQRRITPMHAHALIAWQDVPEFLEKVAAAFPEFKEGADDLPSAVDLGDEANNILHSLSRPMARGGFGRDACHFKPTAEQMTQLDVRKVPVYYGGKAEYRAFNVKLWNELNAAAKKRSADREAKSAPTKPKAKPHDYQADRDRWAIRNALDNLGRAMRLEKCNLLGRLVAEKLEPEKHQLLARRCVLILAALDDHENAFADGLHHALALKGLVRAPAVVGKIVGLTEGALDRAEFAAVQAAFARQRDYRPAVALSVLEYVAKFLKVDFAAEWKPSVKFILKYEGDLRDRLLKQFPADVLAACKPNFTPEKLVKNWPPGFVPHELLAVDENAKIPAAEKRPSKKKVR